MWGIKGIKGAADFRQLRRLITIAFFFLIGLPGLSISLAQTGERGDTIQEFRIGVLATEGATRALEAWGPTAEYLTQAAEEASQPYRFMISPQTHDSMFDAIDAGELDMLLTDPAFFVATEVENGARPLLSKAHMWGDQAYDMTGALVFVRSDSTVRQLEQLEGRSVMAVARSDFAGWWLTEQELRKHRLDPQNMFSELVFSGGNEREVVYAVQSGLVDAGVIRAGVLEALAEQGAIDLGEFAAVSVMQHADFPFLVTTPLYPEWVLAALPSMPEPALTLIINSLLSVSPDAPESTIAAGAVWQAPQNYQPVHDLLISLRARPYENYFMQALTRIFKTYRLPILGLMVVILGSLAFLIYQLRRNIQLAEERKNVLQSEVRSKKFYRSAIEEHTVFCMLTKEGVISHVNDRFLKTSERTRSGLVNKPLTELLSEKDQSLLAQEILSSMEVGVPWAGPLMLNKEDGSAAWVQCTFIPVTSLSEELSEIAIVATDVTNTRKGASEARFQNTLELIQDQVVVMRPSTLELLHCNKAAEMRLVRNRIGGNWKGKKATDFITADDKEQLLMRAEAVIAGPQRRVTWEVDGKDGITYEISLEYAQPDQDEPRLIAIYRDISERKQAEKAKNEFIATVSHELRTPLTSMKGALGLALSGALGDMPEKMNKLITMADSNCDRLVMLINDILDLEKIEAGKMDFKMELLDLRELLDAALEANQFYAEKFGVSFRNDVHEPNQPYMTLGDKVRLRQVMDNLMSNAAKFSPKGAEIIVSLQNFNGRLRITVRDFGTGIPLASQPKIFEKFTQADSSDTRSKGGTGLGLSIAKLIVDNHKGNIFFVSDEGVGTEFFVDLPMVEGEEIVPIPKSEDEEVLPVFSELRIVDEAVETGDAAEGAINQLIDKLRAVSAELGIERGRVNAVQVARGRGVVSQSSVMSYLSATGRAMMTELVDGGLMDNREVMLLEMTLPTGGETAKLAASFALVHEWIAEVANTEDGAPKGAAMSGDGEVTDWASENGYTITPDPAEVSRLAGEDKFDLVALYDENDDTGVVSIYPLTDGDLPEGLPVTLIATKFEATSAERGVVSKFSSGDGGGRGRARRRSAS